APASRARAARSKQLLHVRPARGGRGVELHHRRHRQPPLTGGSNAISTPSCSGASGFASSPSTATARCGHSGSRPGCSRLTAATTSATRLVSGSSRSIRPRPARSRAWANSRMVTFKLDAPRARSYARGMPDDSQALRRGDGSNEADPPPDAGGEARVEPPVRAPETELPVTDPTVANPPVTNAPPTYPNI